MRTSWSAQAGTESSRSPLNLQGPALRLVLSRRSVNEQSCVTVVLDGERGLGSHTMPTRPEALKWSALLSTFCLIPGPGCK